MPILFTDRLEIALDVDKYLLKGYTICGRRISRYAVFGARKRWSKVFTYLYRHVFKVCLGSTIEEQVCALR